MQPSIDLSRLLSSNLFTHKSPDGRTLTISLSHYDTIYNLITHL